jgi:esterase/lipase
VDSIIESIQEYIEENVWKKEMTKFNIRKLKPIVAIEKITCPIFFIGSIQDTFVNVRHTTRLHTKVKTQKKLELVSGDHNDIRSDELKEKVLRFLIDLNLKSMDRGSVK